MSCLSSFKTFRSRLQVFKKIDVLKLLQNSQGSTYGRASFLIKLQAEMRLLLLFLILIRFDTPLLIMFIQIRPIFKGFSSNKLRESKWACKVKELNMWNFFYYSNFLQTRSLSCSNDKNTISLNWKHTISNLCLILPYIVIVILRTLTNYVPVLPSYRNQSIDLLGNDTYTRNLYIENSRNHI